MGSRMVVSTNSMVKPILLPGITICSLMLSIVFSVFFVLLSHPEDVSLRNIIINTYLWKVIKFTFFQAFLSALLSVLIALLLSKSYFRNNFFCNIFLKLSSTIFVLPTTIITIGMLMVYGRSGWISQFFNTIKFEYSFNPYGFNGVILTNVFINLPFAIQLLLRSIRIISSDQWKIIDQLGMRHLEYFIRVEWYYLKRQIVPVFILIFVLSFSNFSIILIVGGGPSSTTIELAIYQMINFGPNYFQAAFLTFVQMMCCLLLITFVQKINIFPMIENDYEELSHNRYCSHIYHDSIVNKIIILISIVFFISPLSAIILDGINVELFKILKDPYFWQSFWNSAVIAIGSSSLCTLFAIIFLWSSRELYFQKMFFLYRSFKMISMTLIVLPNTSLVISLSHLLNDFLIIRSPYPLIIFINALMFVPYSIKMLEIPMNDTFQYYNNLCLSLKITGLNRFFVIEYDKLSYDIKKSFVLSCAFSFGDISTLTIFEENQFSTLPYYLYDHLNHYCVKEASSTSLLMLFFYMILFLSLRKSFQKKYD
ncbi:ABC transporter permease subunit [Candidatus Riesia pediculischaeffi]|nr:ABC transporter permease subunit [Candidatus Riesia pediculischaeffi]